MGAVAAGAVVAASQTASFGAPTTTTVAATDDTLAVGGTSTPGRATTQDRAMTGPAAAPQVLRFGTVVLERDAAAAVDALAKGVAIAEEQAKPELGEPYQAGNDEDLDGWIAQALGLMGLPQSLAPGVREIIIKESRGNSDAINNWDSNASRGTPSEGLMQVIPSSFDYYVLPELRDRPITDPVANITAGVRCMIANHGIETVLQGGRRSGGGGYLGYGGGKPFVPDVAAWAEALSAAERS